MRTVFFITILISLSVLIACKQRETKLESKKATADSVGVFTLKREPVNKQINFPAELIPFNKAEIYAKVSGYIKSINADIGDQVKEGQVLVMLEAPEFFSNYAQAKADMQTAHAKLLGSLDTYKRILRASEVDGTIAANELEKVKSQMMADSSSLEAATSRLNSIAHMRDYLTIRAPFSGIITQRNVDMGTLVGTSTTKALLVLENSTRLRLRVPVPEAYTAAIPDSSFIQFTVDAQPNITYKASLSRKAGTLNLANRTETWEFIYPNNDNELKSGMYANASLKLGRKESSFVVPSTAVATNLEKRFVIRLSRGKTEWIDVRNGITMNDKVEIFGHLLVGDTLLIRSTDEIRPGTELLPKFQSK